VDRAGNADAAGFRQRLEASGDIDPVPVDSVTFCPDLAQMDSNAELHLPGFR
jgi:hypothetical protein